MTRTENIASLITRVTNPCAQIVTRFTAPAALVIRLATSLAVFAACASAQAYIPSDKTIFSRLARNNGKGAYAIEQEVQFRSLTEPVILRERWIVAGGEALRLTVTSPRSAAEQFRFDALYREGKRVAPDLQGGLRSATISQEFFEPYSHFRQGRSFMEALVFSRILPQSFLKPRPPANGKSLPPHQDHVRLGRSNGVVTWTFGEPSPANAQKLNPEAWIEQDAFVLRRLRFPSQTEVSFDNLTSYANSLRLARDRTVSWDNNTATIRVLSVKALPDSAAGQQLSPSSISPADAKAAKLPDLAPVKEFYSRFR